MLSRIDYLLAPQRDALGVAFGLRSGDAPDRFLVGVAMLGLLSAVAEERGLVCVVDDAQWLDRASIQVLTFVARRLFAESVWMVFAVRVPIEDSELNGLPDLTVEDRSEAMCLLAATDPAEPTGRCSGQTLLEALSRVVHLPWRVGSAPGAWAGRPTNP
jgi:hypothetical protein